MACSSHRHHLCRISPHVLAARLHGRNLHAHDGAHDRRAALSGNIRTNGLLRLVDRLVLFQWPGNQQSPSRMLSLACYGIVTLWLLAKKRITLDILPRLAVVWVLGEGLYIFLIVQDIAGGSPVAATLTSALFGKDGKFQKSVLDIFISGRDLLNTVLYLGINLPTPTALLLIPGLIALTSVSGGRPGTARHRDALCYPSALGDALSHRGSVHVLHSHGRTGGDIDRPGSRLVPDTLLSPFALPILLAGAMLPVLVYLLLPWSHKANLPIGLTRTIPYRDDYRYLLQPWKRGYDGPLQFADAAQGGNSHPTPSGSATARPSGRFNIWKPSAGGTLRSASIRVSNRATSKAVGRPNRSWQPIWPPAASTSWTPSHNTFPHGCSIQADIVSKNRRRSIAWSPSAH